MTKSKSCLFVTMCLFLLLSGCPISCPIWNAPEAIDRYSSLSTFKGIDIYVWQDPVSNEVLCGILPGTNRYKTEVDYELLYEQPIDLQTAQSIISNYPSDTYFFVSSIAHAITFEQQAKVEQLFSALSVKHISYFW